MRFCAATDGNSWLSTQRSRASSQWLANAAREAIHNTDTSRDGISHDVTSFWLDKEIDSCNCNLNYI